MWKCQRLIEKEVGFPGVLKTINVGTSVVLFSSLEVSRGEILFSAEFPSAK